MALVHGITHVVFMWVVLFYTSASTAVVSRHQVHVKILFEVSLDFKYLSFNYCQAMGLERWAMLASPLLAFPITQWVAFSRINQLRATESQPKMKDVCFLSFMLMILCSLKWITMFSEGITHEWKYQQISPSGATTEIPLKVPSITYL